MVISANTGGSGRDPAGQSYRDAGSCEPPCEARQHPSQKQHPEAVGARHAHSRLPQGTAENMMLSFRPRRSLRTMALSPRGRTRG